MEYISPWDLTDGQVEQRYKRLAKQLDSRVNRLLKAGYETQATEDYEVLKLDLGGGPKLNKSPENYRNALHRVNDILTTAESSLREVKKHAIQGMKTFRKKYGINFSSPQQYSRFWRSENVKNLKLNYLSGSALKLAEQFVSSDDKSKKIAEEFIDNEGVATSEIFKSLGYKNEAELLRDMLRNR